MNTWKRLLALCLSVLMVLACFTACGKTEKTEEPPEEAKVLKVLTLGHSLALDSCHLLALVAATEGYTEMTVGTLYYSGCSLPSHVEFLTKNTPTYTLYLSSTTNPNVQPTLTENVTMKYAITADYWDIIVMQGGVWELGEDATFTCGNIQTIQNYVNENKTNPNAIFAWHMPWAYPIDPTLRATFRNEPNSFTLGYAKYNEDRTAWYNAFADRVKRFILTDSSFAYMIPSGTAIENALSSKLTEKDLHRDYSHASDLGRLIAAYTWFCVLTGVEKLDTLKLNAIPRALLKTTITAKQEWVIPEDKKAIVIESVNNALANPLQITQSQYT